MGYFSAIHYSLSSLLALLVVGSVLVNSWLQLLFAIHLQSSLIPLASYDLLSSLLALFVICSVLVNSWLHLPFCNPSPIITHSACRLRPVEQFVCVICFVRVNSWLQLLFAIHPQSTLIPLAGCDLLNRLFALLVVGSVWVNSWLQLPFAIYPRASPVRLPVTSCYVVGWLLGDLIIGWCLCLGFGVGIFLFFGCSSGFLGRGVI